PAPTPRRKPAPTPASGKGKDRIVTRTCYLKAAMFLACGVVTGAMIVATIRELSLAVSMTVACGTRVMESSLYALLSDPAALEALRESLTHDEEFWRRAAYQVYQGVTVKGTHARGPNHGTTVKFVEAALGRIRDEDRVGVPMENGLEIILSYEAKHFMQVLLYNYTFTALPAHVVKFVRTMAREKYDLGRPAINQLLHSLRLDGKHWKGKKLTPDYAAAEDYPVIKEIVTEFVELPWTRKPDGTVTEELKPDQVCILDAIEFRKKMNDELAKLAPHVYTRTRRDGTEEECVWRPPRFNLVPFARKARMYITIDKTVMPGIVKRAYWVNFGEAQTQADLKREAVNASGEPPFVLEAPPCAAVCQSVCVCPATYECVCACVSAACSASAGVCAPPPPCPPVSGEAATLSFGAWLCCCLPVRVCVPREV
ncbi:MAG: hypothetical protein P4L40_00795, partial [Terracidiphilus sp.]|nr:hypothetical protein [Terracidiphilus sp.]